MRIYQGQFRVAMLTDGTIEEYKGVDLHLSLHPAANAGLAAMNQNMKRPQVEEIREWSEFEFIALLNTYSGIANSISLGGHGGSIIILPTRVPLPVAAGRIKYPQNSSVLRSSFIDFMNARHKLCDLIAQEETGQSVSPELLSTAELFSQDSYADLVEATRFVAQLAGCDGAIVISEDLYVLGFGCEIRAELKSGSELLEIKDELRNDEHALDVEHFGMRHRSAINLVSQEPRYRILVISQDGPISVVWSKDGRIFLRKTHYLVNANLPWT